MPDPHPDTMKLLSRMTDPQPAHRRFVGAPIDLTQIDALSLGDLWAVAEKVEWRERYRAVKTLAGETASGIVAQLDERRPAFRGSACRDYLDLLSREAEVSARVDRVDTLERRRRACFVLARCADLASDGLGEAAKRFLATGDWLEMPHLGLALARLVDPAFAARFLTTLSAGLAGSSHLVDELGIVASLDLPANILVADVAVSQGLIKDETIETSRYPLSNLPLYVEFAEASLRRAAEHVRAIHASQVAYASDKAFTVQEAQVIARLVRVGLDRDEPWVPSVLEDLFLKASVAPGGAKTMPSQAVAIALGHAIEALPTPEAVDILRKVLRHILHAGVEKKLQRNLRGAERRLADRPQVALRVSLDGPMSKPQLTTLRRTLEAGFGAAVSLGFEDWRMRLAEHPHAGSLARSLVWKICDQVGGGMAVLPIADHGRLELQDVGGSNVSAAPGSQVTLWHPSDATAEERGAWRDRIIALKIKQPFKQAFREHYVVPVSDLSRSETAMFSGHAVSLGPLLGLARREGWRVDPDRNLARAVGRWTITLNLADEVSPGATGWTTTRGVGIWAAGSPKWLPGRLGDLPTVALSEILRSVDLLVSTSGFALTPVDDKATEDSVRQLHLQNLAKNPLGPMAEMRKEAIERVLRGRDEMAALHFDARHLRLGRFAIHLATGRVTRDGEPVELATPKRTNIAAVPWLPYDEKLLEEIVYTALELAQHRG